MTDSPSALLERAATLIEQRAAAAAARPEGPQMQAYAAWWVWLSPFINAPEVVAQPLVEWLQHEATGAERGYFDPSPHAVAFAKLVLGES